MSLLMERAPIWNDGQIIPVQRRPFTTRKRRSMFYQIETSSGLMRAATPADCWWYKIYIEYPMITVPQFHVEFRRCFRLPYAQFIQLLWDAHEKDWLPWWTLWKSKSPLSLLLLGALRYLSRSWIFDDLEEQTLISTEVHHNFFHEFNGCIGSSDATHIAVEKCSYRLQNSHLGAKQHLTTRSFNLSTNHWQKILSVTTGMPRRWNDKTVVLFDRFVHGIYVYQLFPFWQCYTTTSCV